MISIGAVCRQTGIAAATLRKWEERYGFPSPVRTAGDHRVFRPSDLEALIEISRRMAAGQRAGVAVQAVKKGLHRGSSDASEATAVYSPEVQHALALLLQNDLRNLEDFLVNYLTQHGAAAFAHAFANPLIEAVGNLWQRGRLPAYAEHLFSSILQKVVLRTVVRPTKAKIPAPQVLLASPAGEVHTLALALLNAVLHEAGISSVFLQGGLPAAEIAAAAAAFKVQVVALSASVACPPRLLTTELLSLRALLLDRTELWIGGAGTHRISTRLEGITFMASMDFAAQTLKNRFGQDLNLVESEKDRNRD